MTTPFLTRLGRFPSVSDADVRAVSDLISGKPRVLPPRTEISHEGGTTDLVRIVRHGWIARYRSLADGRRQVLSFVLPGDACSLSLHLPAVADHSTLTISESTVSEFSRASLRTLASERPALAAAFGWMEAATLSIQREWTLSLGRRTSHERLAHLLCESYHRLGAAGLTVGDGFSAPLTQVDVAEAIGLSNVHVSRTLKDLRSMGLVTAKGRMVTILDLPGLERAAVFEPGYLMLRPESWLSPEPAAPIPAPYR